MKTFTFPCLVALITLISCSTSQRYGSRVEQESTISKASVDYKSWHYLRDELVQKAQRNMWEPQKTKREINRLPKGGYIIVHIRTQSIDHSNTKYWNYIVKYRDGNDIKRQNGEAAIPDHGTTNQYYTTWKNVSIINLYNDITEPFEVYVIDNFGDERYKYTVYPDSRLD